MGAYIIRANGLPLKFDVVPSETHEGVLQITDHPVEKGANVTDHARRELDRLTLEVFVSNAPIRSDLRDGAVETITLDVLGYKAAGRITRVNLDVKQWEAPLEPTPGSVFNKVEGFISSLFTGKKEYVAALAPGPDFLEGRRYRVGVMTFTTPFDAVADILGALETIQSTAELLTVVTNPRDYEDMLLERYTAPRDTTTGDGVKITLEFRKIRIVAPKIVSAPVAEPTAKKKVDKGAQNSSPSAQRQSVLDKLNALAGNPLGF